MSKPLVYLAGAIAGLAYDDAADWRNIAKHRLAERGIETLSPLRAKSVLRENSVISQNCHDYADLGVFFRPRGIMARDFNDVKRCDALLVNLLDLRKPSMGTIMELGWAYAFQKPAIVAIEAQGNPHDNHPMLLEAMPFRVTSLDEAIDAVAVLLNR